MTDTISRSQFIEAMDTAGLEPYESLREDYSGRYMYGHTCVAVVCDVGEFALLCAALGASADNWDFVGRVRSDNMGLSTVWYWPGVKLDEPGSIDNAGVPGFRINETSPAVAAANDKAVNSFLRAANKSGEIPMNLEAERPPDAKVGKPEWDIQDRGAPGEAQVYGTVGHDGHDWYARLDSSNTLVGTLGDAVDAVLRDSGALYD